MDLLKVSCTKFSIEKVLFYVSFYESAIILFNYHEGDLKKSEIEFFAHFVIEIDLPYFDFSRNSSNEVTSFRIFRKEVQIIFE